MWYGRRCKEQTVYRKRHKQFSPCAGSERRIIDGGLAMYAFTFHRPQTVRQAAGLLGKNPDAKLLAGGQTLLPTMKLRLAGPPQIIDMSLIEGMSGTGLGGPQTTTGGDT